jgi:hypothetical protein
VFVAAGWACGLKGEAELFWNLWLRDELALWIAIAAKEVAEATTALRHLPAVLRSALRARKTGTLKSWDIATRRVVTDYLRKRLPLRVLWVEAAREIPTEAAEALLHWVTLRALLFARSASIVSRTDAPRLLRDKRLKGRPKLTEHFTPVGPPLCDRIKLLLHTGREAEVNERCEVCGQKVTNRLAKARRTKSVVAIAVHILALLNPLDDGRIC